MSTNADQHPRLGDEHRLPNEHAHHDELVQKEPRLGDEHGLFLRSEALAAGLTDRDLLSSEYVRVLHGVYAHAGVALTHELRCRAAARHLPADAVITGSSAATLHGVPLADFADPVEALVPRKLGMHRRYGLRCTAVRTHDFESTAWSGIRLAYPPRVAFDLLKGRSMSTAVARCDALLHAGLLTMDDIAAFLVGRRDHRVSTARARLSHLDARAESIPESVLRVELALRGLHPVPQVRVHDRRGVLARVDLGFEAERVAVEYDGHWHGDAARFWRDQQRLDALRRAGWTVVVVTAQVLREDVDGVVEQVRAALARRGRSFS